MGAPVLAPSARARTEVVWQENNVNETNRDDQARSVFTDILDRFLAACDGAFAAVLVDYEGEAVDYADTVENEAAVAPFDIKLAAAHWQIVMRQLNDCPVLGNARHVVIQAEHCGYVIRPLPSDYWLVLLCRPNGAFNVSSRALDQVVMELSVEAGWPPPAPEQLNWQRVAVTVDTDGRPSRIGLQGRYLELEEIEPLNEVDELERGYRVLTAEGGQWVLVRERTGLWYAGLRPSVQPACGAAALWWGGAGEPPAARPAGLFDDGGSGARAYGAPPLCPHTPALRWTGSST